MYCNIFMGSRDWDMHIFSGHYSALTGPSLVLEETLHSLVIGNDLLCQMGLPKDRHSRNGLNPESASIKIPVKSSAPGGSSTSSSRPQHFFPFLMAPLKAIRTLRPQPWDLSSFITGHVRCRWDLKSHGSMLSHPLWVSHIFYYIFGHPGSQCWYW